MIPNKLVMYDGKIDDAGFFFIRVLAPTDRNNYGYLSLYHPDGYMLYGPAEVYLRADDRIAVEHENEERDSLKPYGDTPIGVYSAVIQPASENHPSYNIPYNTIESKNGLESFGKQGMILLNPISGEALIAQNEGGRRGLKIHGGDLRDGLLRPTAGCVRVRNGDVSEIIGAIMATVFHKTGQINTQSITGKVEIIKYDGDFLPGIQGELRCSDPITEYTFSGLGYSLKGYCENDSQFFDRYIKTWQSKLDFFDNEYYQKYHDPKITRNDLYDMGKD